jgi:zinc protease
VDNNNFGVLFEQFNAAAFIAHPYHWPVLGWMSDIESWTMDDLKAHFSMGYAPNNAVMVVCGNVRSAEFLALAEKYIGTIPPRDPPPPLRTTEPEQLGEHRVRVEKLAQLPIVIAGWHVPETANPDYYPLSVMSLILTGGQSSRLYRRLVDKDQLVISVNGGIGFAFDPTLLRITMQPRTGVAPEAAEKALYEEIARLQRDGAEEREMQKAKNILLAQFYRSMKTISGQANTLGSYEIFFGDYKKLLEAPDRFEKVTAEDVQRVAKKYLTEKNRTVGTLIPTKGDK